MMQQNVVITLVVEYVTSLNNLLNNLAA